MVLFLNTCPILIGQTAEFEFDSLSFYFQSIDYKGAKKYLDRERKRIAINDDSALLDLKLVYSKLQIYNSEFDIGLEGLKEVEYACHQSGYKLLQQKAIIQIADCYRTIRMNDKALNEINKIDIEVLQSDPFLLCKYYHRKAAIYNERFLITKSDKDLDTSIQLSHKSLLISKQHKYVDAMATSYNELAANKSIDKKLSKLYSDSAILIWKEFDLANYINALNNKANGLFNDGKYTEALSYLIKCEIELKGKEFPFLKVSTYRLLSKTYYQLRDTLNGKHFELLEQKAKGNYWERLAESRLHELTVQYETVEKDAIILARNISIQEEEERVQQILIFALALLIFLLIIGYFYLGSKTKNKRLKELLDENEFLIGESNHRIKNNLQLIVSLIERELFKEGIENSKLTEISEKIKSIAILHQQLYMKQSKEEVSVKSYLEEIKQNLESSVTDKDIRISLLVEEFALEIDKSVFLGLLITELITNSLKHAFVEKDLKEINIQVFKKSDIIHLQYADSGCGIPVGKNPSLVLILIKQLKGEFSLNSENGLKIKLKFKP